jgi:predicted 3-demethylubiquinone-9 3-methyltransferase (glyoxalase superfamily)
MGKITPFLWFDDNAEDAINFYVSVFRNSKIISTIPGPGGKMMGASFLLDGQEIQALNGGPMLKFNEAISLFVKCETQGEIDYFWEKLSEGGKKSRCGWLKDKFGLSWQIVPPVLSEFLQDKNPEKAKKVMLAMLEMDKIDIQGLKQAYEQ